MTDIKLATPWDAVCAANQQLDAAGVNLRINEFIPGTYELRVYYPREATQEGEEIAYDTKRIGRTMNEAEMLAFVKSPLFGSSPSLWMVDSTIPGVHT